MDFFLCILSGSGNSINGLGYCVHALFPPTLAVHVLGHITQVAFRFLLTVERNTGTLSFVYRKEKGVAEDKGDLLQGTLDMLVLKALALEPMHGWGITERIEHWSESVLQLGQGSLYPALYRLERQGLVRSEWKLTENNRRARYYSLTRAGRRHFLEELAEWRRVSRAVNLVLAATTAN